MRSGNCRRGLSRYRACCGHCFTGLRRRASPVPDGVRLLDWELEEGCLHLDLSEQYGSLTGVDLTVADACLTLTLCQVEGVESVYVTVEGNEIPYRSIQQLTLEDVLLSTGQESPPPQEESVETSTSAAPG